ncbi:MAG: DNA-3-methyladenine glycosylase [Deltaproteobacteria bacterium]|nr:DNA-3-methyladenine glycosylase [Deltaproteobacteria bacterium]
MARTPKPVHEQFFDRDPVPLARALVGTVLRRRLGGQWLAAKIVETEAYALDEPASHSSLGRTPSREPMFAPPGTLYLYWSRGGPSLNLSARGSGDAVLIKAAVPHVDSVSPPQALEHMRTLLPPLANGPRATHRLCSGQSLLCRALDLHVKEWTGLRFDPARFVLEDLGDRPELVQARRLGISAVRSTGLPWRFVHREHVRSATKNPLTRRGAAQGVDYWMLPSGG